MRFVFRVVSYEPDKVDGKIIIGAVEKISRLRSRPFVVLALYVYIPFGYNGRAILDATSHRLCRTCLFEQPQNFCGLFLTG
ncbi:MAG: hypothetical protein CO149_05030 [Nitrospirae bacterium CG_4_9_14_3_um_filter_51_5]|nr:MAG: hypothetical protein CO149_05030 [Nitrospirae bacterium CG_4_9_14_3_um_filter_51_5]